MKSNPKLQIDETKLPQEALAVLKVLDEIENHTADLRKKLLAEFKTEKEIHLNLDDVNKNGSGA